MTTQSPSLPWRNAGRRGRGQRGIYLLAVVVFTSAFTPAVSDALTDTGAGIGAIRVLVLFGLALLGLICGVVGSLLLDVLLLLAARVAGRDVVFTAVSRTVDQALPILAAGVLVAAVYTAILGPERAFASPVPGIAMAGAAAAHVAVLFRRLPDLGFSTNITRTGVLGVYVAVPAILIAVSGGGA